MGEVPPSHPRYNSLIARKLLTDAADDGLLADSALIAHGRGEAYDYLLGEKTSASALLSIKQAAAVMKNANKCVISLNGNAVALAAENLLRCATILQCPVEINIYYRTPERMKALLSRLEKVRQEVMKSKKPHGWLGNWEEDVLAVPILGAEPNGRIPNLDGPRANCCKEGILDADVIFVPLEDGDRCEALMNMGKTVIVVDLNPLSRTAKMASITIVDELMRVGSILIDELVKSDCKINEKWDNKLVLDAALNEINSNIQN